MTNSASLETVNQDKRTDLFVRLQSAVEASRGFIRWADVLLGIQRAKERKLQEMVGSLINSMALIDLVLAEEVALRECGFADSKSKTVEVIPVARPSVPIPTKKRRTR